MQHPKKTIQSHDSSANGYHVSTNKNNQFRQGESRDRFRRGMAPFATNDQAPDDCQRWNKKAARYDSRDAKNLYAEAFVELAGVQPGETIFDMGCGTGTLAAEMATRGHKVIVGDFSSGMLAKLRENMALRDIKVAESLMRSRQAAFSLCA